MAARKTQSSLFWRAACPVLPTQRSLSEWIDRIVDCWIDWLIVLVTDWLINWLIFCCWFQGNLLGNPKFINWSPVKRWDQAFSFLAYFKTLLQVGYILEFWKVPNPSWWHSCSQILQVIAVFCCCEFCLALLLSLDWSGQQKGADADHTDDDIIMMMMIYNDVDDDIKWWWWWWCQLFEEV